MPTSWIVSRTGGFGIFFNLPPCLYPPTKFGKINIRRRREGGGDRRCRGAPSQIVQSASFLAHWALPPPPRPRVRASQPPPVGEGSLPRKDPPTPSGPHTGPSPKLASDSSRCSGPPTAPRFWYPPWPFSSHICGLASLLGCSQRAGAFALSPNSLRDIYRSTPLTLFSSN